MLSPVGYYGIEQPGCVQGEVVFRRCCLEGLLATLCWLMF
jgi:hypothetical protein